MGQGGHCLRPSKKGGGESRGAGVKPPPGPPQNGKCSPPLSLGVPILLGNWVFSACQQRTGSESANERSQSHDQNRERWNGQTRESLERSPAVPSHFDEVSGEILKHYP